MTRRHLSLQWKFLLSITVIIFPILGMIFAVAVVQNRNQAMEQVLNQARILSRQLILTRQWIADCGGVMALRGSEGVRGTSCFYDDRLETSEGSYQRFTPAMVTQKLSEYSMRQDLYHFRLSGLTPLNPKNSPDDFEKQALRQFVNQNISEVTGFQSLAHGEYFRYMVPLHMDASCLECHNQQGLSHGSVLGGLSVLLPIEGVRTTLARDHWKLVVAGVALMFVTVLTLFVLLRRIVIRPLNQMENMAGEIGQGNLNARVEIVTGDEFEKLGSAFNHMAARLSRGRDRLQEKIERATQELLEANRELETLDQLKTDFIASMSHELRSPLTVIRGGVDYLKRTVKGTDNRNYLSIIDKNLSRLIHLVTDLFDFTRIEAEKMEWAFEQENVSGLVREVTEILAPLANDRGISLRFDSKGDIFAKIDLERIEQVLVNLLENAIKFSGNDTEIRIETVEEDDAVVVAVKDQGMGISVRDLDAIFEKFHTTPASEGKRRSEGTGLGLAICKGIVEAHGGTIWAESAPGAGSVFYFTLPRCDS